MEAGLAGTSAPELVKCQGLRDASGVDRATIGPLCSCTHTKHLQLSHVCLSSSHHYLIERRHAQTLHSNLVRE
jgi:hypothetical protein